MYLRYKMGFVFICSIISKVSPKISPPMDEATPSYNRYSTTNRRHIDQESPAIEWQRLQTPRHWMAESDAWRYHCL